MWWPGIAGDVKNIVASCDHCQTFKPSQRKEPLVTTPLPDLPWQKIGVDLCQFERHEYLVMAVYHSRWINHDVFGCYSQDERCVRQTGTATGSILRQRAPVCV